MSIGYKWPILQDMTIRIADCYFWNQAYYIYLVQEISMGLFKEDTCHICKKEAVYFSQKKNTTQRITVRCTETSENMIKRFTELKNEVQYRESSVIWLQKNFHTMTSVITY